MELEKQVSGLAAVVEKIFELENSDAIFAVFYFEKQNQVLLIARSQKDTFEVNKVLMPFGGGGHTHAASALMKDMQGEHVYNNLKKYLKSAVLPAIKAEDIMTKQVDVLGENISLMDASIYLENVNHTGAPVINETGAMCGFLTLRNIMKGRKANQMHAPVKAYMTKKVITGSMNMNLRDIENIFYNNNIGHLPIMHVNRLVGILTRTDFLNYLGKDE
jgi:tRNA nucleotidyltransferase (CCA-adding enzyme)